MFKKIETLLKKDKALRAKLNTANRNFEISRAAGNGRECVHLDFECSYIECALIALSEQNTAVLADLEEYMFLLEIEAETVDNLRAHALDASHYTVEVCAIDEFSALESEWKEALWSSIWLEHETVWTNEFAPNFS